MTMTRYRCSRWAFALVGVLASGAVLSSAASASLDTAAARIEVMTPAQVKRETVYDVTISGFSPSRIKAYLFIDYQGCATSFITERSRAGDESESYTVKGTFALTSGWRSADVGYDHACAYLVSNRSGAPLATAKRSYRVH